MPTTASSEKSVSRQVVERISSASIDAFKRSLGFRSILESEAERSKPNIGKRLLNVFLPVTSRSIEKQLDASNSNTDVQPKKISFKLDGFLLDAALWAGTIAGAQALESNLSGGSFGLNFLGITLMKNYAIHFLASAFTRPSNNSDLES